MIWQDPIAMSIPNRLAVEQLIAKLDQERTIHMDALAYRFDIVLRGRQRPSSRIGGMGPDVR